MGVSHERGTTGDSQFKGTSGVQLRARPKIQEAVVSPRLALPKSKRGEGGLLTSCLSPLASHVLPLTFHLFPSRG